MRKTFTKFLTVLMLSLLTTGVIAQEIYYVNVANPTPGNGKTTWANAFTDLQEALDIAVSGDQIWVAKGTYKPSKTLGGIVESPISRDATFVLSEGVKIYGGFDGTETLLSARDAAKIHTDNKTTLSGDFNDDDVVDYEKEDQVVNGNTVEVITHIKSITGNTDNAHHVVVSYNNTAATVLDGFTISGGNADGSETITVDTDYDFSQNHGGGIYVRLSSPTLNNLVVKNNRVLARGAGVYVATGKKIESPKSAEDITISNSLFEYNWGSEIGTSFGGSVGGGMAITGTSGYVYKANIINSVFNGNWGGGIAGGLRVYSYINVEVMNSTFTHNRSRHGGALYVQSNRSTPVKIIGSTFRRNFGGNGGAVQGNLGANIVVENTHFLNNEATSGAGIHIVGDAGSDRATLDISGGSFENNTATTAGGIRVSQLVDVNINGTSFTKNKSTGAGGGAFYALGSSTQPINTTITNASFTDNEGTEGGAIRASTESTLNITDTDFIENKGSSGGGAIFMTGTVANPSVINITGGLFRGNSANPNSGTVYGGALYKLANSTLKVARARFVQNIARSSGGAVYVAGKTTTIDNSVFYKNSSPGSGGAVTFASSVMATATGNTFYDNEATGAGGAIRVASGTIKIYNSIISNNLSKATPVPTHDISNDGTLEVKYSITQQYGTDGVDGVKVGAVPQFISTTYDGNTDFLKLAPVTGNPAIDAGDNELVPKVFNNDDPPVDITTDLAGVLRFNGTVDLGAYENHTPLPVKLSDLSAKANTSSIVVNWTTETETNNSHFILEKSTDGVNFVTIANVPSKGNGAKYSYTDFSPGNGANYYRLTQVDHDGNKVTYNPIVVNFGLKASTVNVYPNPANGATVNVDFGAERYDTLDVLSVSGQVLQSHHVTGASSAKIDVSALAKGVYLIKLSKSGASTVQKLIKN